MGITSEFKRVDLLRYEPASGLIRYMFEEVGGDTPILISDDDNRQCWLDSTYSKYLHIIGAVDIALLSHHAVVIDSENDLNSLLSSKKDIKILFCEFDREPEREVKLFNSVRVLRSIGHYASKHRVTSNDGGNISAVFR